MPAIEASYLAENADLNDIIMKGYEPDPFIESLILEVKTRNEIAAEYKTTNKTLLKKLRNLGVNLPPGRIFPDTCKLIYYTLGIPAGLRKESEVGKEEKTT